MILRALTLAGGLAGAAGLSQYPEFAQQYLQRLAGQVDALTVVVADFDRSAAASGLTRDAALSQMQGTDFLAARQRDMAATFARHAGLEADLALLRLASPMERMLMPHRMADAATFQATWADFRPALPLTVEGAVAGGAGWIAGWAGVTALLALMAAPFRRRPAGPPKTEPPLARPGRRSGF